MEFNRLGNTGLQVSAVGLGCNNFGMRCDQAATTAVVNQCFDDGINFFDTADIYGGRGKSEEMLGVAVGNKRQEVIIATKFAGPMGDNILDKGGSRGYINKAVERSLARLNTDYIDLYQIHFPDADTPILETLEALSDLVTAGKVRYIGCSNFSGWQLVEADWTAEHHGLQKFVTAQNNYSLLDRRVEPEVIPACEEYGLGMLPYFPLASGMLTGKYQRGKDAPEGTRIGAMGERAANALSDRVFDIIEPLEAYAKDHGHTLLDLAFSYLATQDCVPSVIAGATKPEQVTSNANAAGWKLTPDEMGEVKVLSKR